jgi:uncharacterized phage protein gp47/JayE
MACEIERPSPRVLFESIKSMFSSNVLGGAPIIPESNEWYVVSNDYAMAEQFYSISEQAWRERDPRFACCDNLVEMAAMDGFYPRPATFASGYIQLSGTPNTLLTASIEVSIAGQQFVNAGPVPARLNNAGVATVRMRALEPGPAGNLPQGTSGGSLTTPIVGVNSNVTIYGNQFCGGAEAEECEAFRVRYLERLRYKPNFSLDKVKEALLEWPCITNVCERGGVCCYDDDVPDWSGGVDCGRPIRLYAIFDGIFEFGAAPAEQLNEINEWLWGTVQGVGQGVAPWGVTGKVFPFTGAYIDIDIDGMACVSPATTNEIEARITEYVARMCPSQILYRRDIEAIISQLTAGTGNYDIILRSDTPNIRIDFCGDANPECDIRIVLRQINFTNPGA